MTEQEELEELRQRIAEIEQQNRLLAASIERLQALVAERQHQALWCAIKHKIR